ncbi:MAG: sigma-E factor negative regulatory protein [Gammaproteobacteria bacterium]|nr:sigma-E factor negative regulatory protein [Gammaproteobacteria bacterium]
MAEELKEQLSALVDGELPTDRLHNTLSRVLSDAEAQSDFARYQLIGDIMRGEAYGAEALGAPPSMRENIAQAIAQEPHVIAAPAPSAAPEASSAEAVRPDNNVFVPLAIAATLVMGLAMAVLYQQSEPPGAPRIADTSPSVAVDPPVELTARAPGDAPLRWSVSDPAIEARLRRYMVSHSEYSGRGMHGMHPYARVVVYQQ